MEKLAGQCDRNVVAFHRVVGILVLGALVDELAQLALALVRRCINDDVVTDESAGVVRDDEVCSRGVALDSEALADDLLTE